MMYVIFNTDGSIKSKQIAEFIQQGNNNVNALEVAFEGYTSSDILLVANFTLPNGQVVVIHTSSPTSFDNHYGRKILLTDDVTSLSGVVKCNLQVLDAETDKVLTTYTLYLSINEGVSNYEVALMSEYEYRNLIQLINSQQAQYTPGIGIDISPLKSISIDEEVVVTKEFASETYATKSEVATLKANIIVLVNTTTYPELADFLASTGEEGKIYWYPIDTSDLTKGYQTYVWENNAFIFAGNTIIDLTSVIALGVQFMTTAPTSANTGSLKFVVLSSEPATKYSGYIYLITGSNE